VIVQLDFQDPLYGAESSVVHVEMECVPRVGEQVVIPAARHDSRNQYKRGDHVALWATVTGVLWYPTDESEDSDEDLEDPFVMVRCRIEWHKQEVTS